MLARALGMVHCLTLIAAIANPLPFWAKILLTSGTLGSLWLSLRHYVFQPVISVLVRKPEGDWTLTLKNGKTLAANLQGTTLVTIWFTLLHLRTDAGLRAVLICRDSLDAEGYRLLRVSLNANSASGSPLP